MSRVYFEKSMVVVAHPDDEILWYIYKNCIFAISMDTLPGGGELIQSFCVHLDPVGYGYV